MAGYHNWEDKQIVSGTSIAFKNYVPDKSPRETAVLPGVLQRQREKTSISRYVWLPIEWDGDKPVIRWHDKWQWKKGV